MYANLAEMFFATCSRRPDKTGMMFKKEGFYRSLSYREISERVRYLAAGLAASLDVHKYDNIILLSENRYEWALCDYAILSTGAVTVPVYPTLLPDQIQYIINNSEANIVIASSEMQLEKVFKVKDEIENVKHFIIIDEKPAELETVTALNEIEKTGKKYLSQHPDFVSEMVAKLTRDDLATIIYTSGTTGDPKGAVLSHGNLLFNTAAGAKAIPLNDNDSALSFLPLSHSFERTAGHFTAMYVGGTIAYAESIETVADNMLEIQPTLMASVPRLFEKIFDRIITAVEEGPPMKRKLFFWAVETGKRRTLYRQKQQKPPLALRVKHKIADRLIFSKIKRLMGGRLRLAISGGAPLAKEIGEFFTAIDLLVLEGYGLTETSPTISVNRMDKFKFGTVGIPLDGIEVMIAEDGEILTRGPHVMQGYFRNEADTRAMIDEDGWLHTGDIGIFDEEGFLKITDRKKNLIVTAGGKNIAPQKMETLLVMSRYVDQVLVIGDRRKYCSAVIVPNFENLGKYAREHDIPAVSDAELCISPQILQLMQREIDAVNEKCASFETIKRFLLLEHPFSIESGELTPSMKVKRKRVEENYKTEIEAMYEDGDAAVQKDFMH